MPRLMPAWDRRRFSRDLAGESPNSQTCRVGLVDFSYSSTARVEELARDASQVIRAHPTPQLFDPQSSRPYTYYFQANWPKPAIRATLRSVKNVSRRPLVLLGGLRPAPALPQD